MTNDALNRKSVVVAAIIASFLMLVLGLMHRVLAGRLLTPGSTTPIDAAALDPFPVQIGDWTGEDVPFDEAEAILGEINAEATVNRRYARGDNTESILLFVAASGITTETLVGHPPEVCNVWNGYRLVDQRSVGLRMADARKLPCRIVRFSRGGSLDLEKKTVLYYYMADEQFCGSRSVLRSRVRRGPITVHCIAQVQIVASSAEGQTVDSATRIVSDFAVTSAPAIAGLFENLQKDLSSGSSDMAPDEEE